MPEKPLKTGYAAAAHWRVSMDSKTARLSRVYGADYAPYNLFE